MVDIATKFNNEPNLTEFIELCDEFSKSADFKNISTQNLEVYSSVLQCRSIPIFFGNERGAASLVKIFNTPAAIGCLTSRSRDAPGSETEDLLQSSQQILEATSSSDLLQISAAETTSLIWGSRVSSIASLRDSSESSTLWVSDLKLYSNWSARRMIEDRIVDGRLFDKGIKIGAPREFAEPFMNHVSLFKNNIRSLRPAQEDFLLRHGLLTLLPPDPSVSGHILYDIGINAEVSSPLCYKLPTATKVIRAAIILARETGTLFTITKDALSPEWADRSFVMLTPSSKQQALTQILIGASMSSPTDQVNELSHSPTFTQGVSNHLQSTSSSVRELGTLLAEVIAKRGGSDLEFGLVYTGYEWWIGRDEIASTDAMAARMTSQQEDKSTASLKNILSGGERRESEQDMKNAVGKDSDDDISDEESVDPPYFLKDLIAYLRSEKYAVVQSALDHGATLILRKVKFGSEVPHYAEDILSAACSLNDKFSINNFNEKRQSILNAVLIADPNQALTLVQMFVSGDWSLAQRQSLLSTSAYAAHASAKGEQSSSQELLPTRLHKLFITNTDQIGIESQSSAKTKPLTAADNEVSNAAGSRAGTKPLARNNFSAVSNKFFFSLLAARPPLRQSSYDAMVFAQWSRTLAVIVVEAYPTQFIPEMIAEFWPLLTSLINQSAMNIHEAIVLEALYASLSMVISVGKALIVQEFGGDLGAVFDQLAAGIEQSTAVSPQSLVAARAALAQFAQMSKEINERSLTRS